MASLPVTLVFCFMASGSTTPLTLCVLDAMRDEYMNVNANVHRGVHYLSQQATDLHEAARERVRGFINASKVEEIVFTRGTTEAINLVANSFCESQMQAGDEVIVTEMEHHSNIVSWQLQAMKRGIIVRHIPITDDGILCLDQLESLITDKTKMISVAHVSNVLGTVNPIENIVKIAEHGDLVRQYLGTVVPYKDNFFAALNSAVFSDGSFVYIPKGVRCPMELSSYFRINARNTGQFERTLIIADDDAYVSYLEGCTAPGWKPELPG